MKYVNPDKQAIECDYEFPLDPKTIFSALECQIDDKKVSAVVKTEYDAKKEYKEALAAGKSAVLA